MNAPTAAAPLSTRTGAAPARRAAAARGHAPPKGEAALEREIGSRWFAIGGAVVVVIGAALFLKLAWDQGWLGQMPDSIKCLSAALFGMGLIGVGEIALRRYGALAAAGLSAAGVGVVYAAGYAAYGMFELVGAPAAFAMLVGVAALGIGVALRARLGSVAFVSLLGGYMAPLLLGVETTRSFIFPTHLAALLLTALVIATVRGGGFTALRALSWWATVALGGAWALAEGRAHPLLALAFLGVAWAMIHAEIVVSARRRHASGKTAMGEAPLKWGDARFVLSSFAISTWAVTLGVVALRKSGLMPDWTAPAAAFVATGWMALVMAGSLRVLRDLPRTAVERVGAALAMQSGAALAATMSLGLAGTPETMAWLALGVAGVCAGRWMRSGGLDAFGVGMLAIGTVRLVIFESGAAWAPGGRETLGIVLSEWTMLALVGAAAWMAAGRLMLIGANGARRELAGWFAGLATLLVFAAPLHKETEPGSLALLWTALSMAALFAHAAAPRLKLPAIATGGLTLATGAWAIAHVAPGWSTVNAELGLHPGLIAAALISGAWCALAWRARRVFELVDTWEAIRFVATIASVGMVFVASSFEVARGAAELAQDEMARVGALTIWWGLFGVGMIGAGFWRRIPGARYAGLGLVTIAVGKAMLLDLAMAPPAWRVASFVALGLLMLGVAVVYARGMGRKGGEAVSVEGGARGEEEKRERDRGGVDL